MAKETQSATSASVIAECVNMKNNLINAGEFIRIGAAASSLQAYLDDSETPGKDDPKHIYGHMFGINKLRALINNFDAYNEAQPNDTKITGVRIYYGIAQRHDTDFPLDPPDGFFRDLIFMPVILDGDDVYPINPDLTEFKLILSESRPCPTQCPTFLKKLV